MGHFVTTLGCHGDLENHVGLLAFVSHDQMVLTHHGLHSLSLSITLCTSSFFPLLLFLSFLFFCLTHSFANCRVKL